MSTQDASTTPDPAPQKRSSLASAAERSFGQRRRDAEAAAEALSPRQREVLAHLLRGGSVKEIARDLDLSEHTVQEYIKMLHKHFNVSSRGELLALFVPTWF